MPDEPETPNSPTPETPPAPNPSETPPNPNDPPAPLIGEPKAEDGPPAEFVPLTAEDITFPENFEVSDEYRDNFLTIVNDQEMSPKDRSQALTDLYVKAATAASEASSKAFADTQTEWQNAVKADPEVGGDKLTPTLAAISKLTEEYGSPELLEVFAATGAGNSVHVIKFLNKIAAVLGEGKPVAGVPGALQTTAAERMFPSMKGK